MAANRLGVVYIDAQGERVMHVITSNANAGILTLDIEDLSNSRREFQWQAGATDFVPAPVVATYPSVRVQAQLIFRDVAGSIAKLWIPAPKSSIFLPDGVTVDPSAIATLISDATGLLLAGSGNPVAAFVGGQLISTKISGVTSLQVFTP